jgi:hypothetical protein
MHARIPFRSDDYSRPTAAGLLPDICREAAIADGTRRNTNDHARLAPKATAYSQNYTCSSTLRKDTGGHLNQEQFTTASWPNATGKCRNPTFFWLPTRMANNEQIWPVEQSIAVLDIKLMFSAVARRNWRELCCVRLHPVSWARRADRWAGRAGAGRASLRVLKIENPCCIRLHPVALARLATQGWAVVRGGESVVC